MLTGRGQFRVILAQEIAVHYSRRAHLAGPHGQLQHVIVVGVAQVVQLPLAVLGLPLLVILLQEQDRPSQLGPGHGLFGCRSGHHVQALLTGLHDILLRPGGAAVSA